MGDIRKFFYTLLDICRCFFLINQIYSGIETYLYFTILRTSRVCDLQSILHQIRRASAFSELAKKHGSTFNVLLVVVHSDSRIIKHFDVRISYKQTDLSISWTITALSRCYIFKTIECLMSS